ncbi:MAG: alpha/beta hydrolase [Pseudomonadota bacterium]
MSADLPPPLDGDLHQLHGRAGRLAYYVQGNGPPVLLVHSINAAGSAYEMRPLVERLCKEHRVYAVDLPGFGLSDRSDRDYNIALYATAVEDMLAHIALSEQQAIRVVSLSLSSEFVARALNQNQTPSAPFTVDGLVMITPTGFRRGDDKRTGPEGSSREIRWFSRLLKLGSLGKNAFSLLAKPKTIRYFLKRTWGSDNIDEGLWHYDTLTTQQPGAHFAPVAFLSGKLFSRDCHSLYRSLRLPVLVIHGTRGDFKDFRGSQWTDSESNWRIEPYPTGALVHFEQPDQVHAEIAAFFESLSD